MGKTQFLAGPSAGEASLPTAVFKNGEPIYLTDLDVMKVFNSGTFHEVAMTEGAQTINDKTIQDFTLGALGVNPAGFLDKNGVQIIQVVATTSATSWIAFNNGTTSSPCALAVVGGSGDVDFNLRPKGLGKMYGGNGSRQMPINDCQTSFPTATYSGEVCYRTDRNEFYYYDDSRSKWLSHHMFTQHHGRAGSALSGVLRGTAGATLSASNGFHVPYDATIVGFSWEASGFSTATLTIKDIVPTTLVTKSSLTAAGADMALNVDVAAGDQLVADITAGTMSNPTCTIYLRRR